MCEVLKIHTVTDRFRKKRFFPTTLSVYIIWYVLCTVYSVHKMLRKEQFFF